MPGNRDRQAHDIRLILDLDRSGGWRTDRHRLARAIIELQNLRCDGVDRCRAAGALDRSLRSDRLPRLERRIRYTAYRDIKRTLNPNEE